MASDEAAERDWATMMIIRVCHNRMSKEVTDCRRSYMEAMLNKEKAQKLWKVKSGQDAKRDQDAKIGKKLLACTLWLEMLTRMLHERKKMCGVDEQSQSHMCAQLEGVDCWKGLLCVSGEYEQMWARWAFEDVYEIS